MNLKELDTVLRRITEHEEEYRKGRYRDYSAIYSSKRVHGQDVLYFSLKNLEPSKEGLSLLAKKHSRFQHFPAHCHSDIEINYIYSGTCAQIINGKRYVLTEGQTIFLNYDTIHQIEPLGEEDILINLNIEPDYLTSNFFNRFSSESIVMNFFLNAMNDRMAHHDFLIFHSQDSERLRLFIGEFMCEWFDPSLVSSDILSSLLTLILSELINVYKKDLSKQYQDYSNTSVIAILHYIESNYKTCRLKETAGFFNLNPNYLSNLLKKTTGFSFRELVLQQKLNAAKLLLKNSSYSVTEICSQIGYQNVSFFYDKFQNETGLLPGDYRKRYRQHHFV